MLKYSIDMHSNRINFFYQEKVFEPKSVVEEIENMHHRKKRHSSLQYKLQVN